jgi:hypothetical protein
MIKVVCDICLKEINPQSQPHICDKHLPFAERFYKEQLETIKKAVDGHRSRFLQTVINKPRPIEVSHAG